MCETQKEEADFVLALSFFQSLTHWGTMWELSFGGKRCDETFCATKRQEQNEDQYSFCHKANRFWHLAECHAGLLLKMALAHINIPLQQPEHRQGVSASYWHRAFCLGGINDRWKGMRVTKLHILYSSTITEVNGLSKPVVSCITYLHINYILL